MTSWPAATLEEYTSCHFAAQQIIPRVAVQIIIAPPNQFVIPVPPYKISRCSLQSAYRRGLPDKAHCRTRIAR